MVKALLFSDADDGSKFHGSILENTMQQQQLMEMDTDGTNKDTSSELNYSGSIDSHGDVNVYYHNF